MEPVDTRRSAATAVGRETAAPQQIGQLHGEALRRRDVVVLALASSGPTQSVAVTLAAILAAVGYAGFLPIVICFVPMLGIALGYQRLNAWQPSAGATYSWVGRVLNPHAGFFAGWIMLLYYTVGTTSLTLPLGSYTLSYFSDSAANNKYEVAAVGTVLNLLVLVIAAFGATLSARFQWILAAFEYVVLAGFAAAAIVYVYHGHHAGVVQVDTSWFTLHGAGGFNALISGVLIAVFLYSGWDTAAYVGEESRGRSAGRAAVTAVVLLFVIYSVAIFAFQGIASKDDMQNNAANILAFIGDQIGGSFWKWVMITAVLCGTLASLQAAIVSSSRISFAMGRDRVLPPWLGRTHPAYRTPWNATILFGLLNVVFLWGSTLFNTIGSALDNIVSTLGLMAAIFYFLTATTALWYYRRQITATAADFFLGGLLPALGAAFMAFVVIYSLTTGSLTAVEIIFGLGLAGLGLGLSFLSARVGHSRYYSDPRVSWGDHIDQALTAAASTTSPLDGDPAEPAQAERPDDAPAVGDRP